MPERFAHIKVEALEEGGYLAMSDGIPGLVAQGRTYAETVEIAADVARETAESCIEHGDPLPPCLETLPPERLTIPVSVEE
jgi:predicted RNase H-like HicB family nuclease